jgi:Ca-activated chloride channel family protein
MVDDDELNRLRAGVVPAPDAEARKRALGAAMAAFDDNFSPAPQGSASGPRLIQRAQKLWREIMQKKLIAAPAVAGLVALPIAGYTALYLMKDQPFNFGGNTTVTRTLAEKPVAVIPAKRAVAETEVSHDLPETSAQSKAEAPAATVAVQQDAPAMAVSPAPVAESMAGAGRSRQVLTQKMMVEPNMAPMPAPADMSLPQTENRDRLENFRTNPVRSVAEDPVSTFSIDVDTASYSFVRRSLEEGMLPQADTVRVEEMVNYFPYDWKQPDSAATPFNSTVSVMPTPWNQHTKLMHVAIKGYDVQPAVQPKANLVFLIDVSGSMNAPDKLPLLQSAFRMLVGKLKADDTVSIVTYAGEAGVVLKPTRVSEKGKILQAIDTLSAGGSTAGEAGIREAYRLAQSSFVKDGVNRVMLATDGDFNIGQSDDDDLKRLI